MIGLEVADVTPERAQVAWKRVEKVGTFVGAYHRFAEAFAKECGGEEKIRCFDIEMVSNASQVMGGRSRLAVDVSIELLPVDIDCTAQMRN